MWSAVHAMRWCLGSSRLIGSPHIQQMGVGVLRLMRAFCLRYRLSV